MNDFNNNNNGNRYDRLALNYSHMPCKSTHFNYDIGCTHHLYTFELYQYLDTSIILYYNPFFAIYVVRNKITF
jgi:hypothetical protein